jgi:hypothetical protein
LITYSETVRLDLGEVLNASRVAFYVADPGGAIQIGTDEDPWDVAILDYDFPFPGTYTFQAVAQNETMQVNTLPVTIIYDPNYTPPGGQRNVLTVSPYTRYQDGWTYVRGNTMIAIIWSDAPVGATRIDFTMAPTGTGITPTPIGTDQNAADGGMVSWFVPTGMLGYLQAVATMPDGSQITSEMLGVVAEG